MYILTTEACKNKDKGKKQIGIKSRKPIRALKIIYETDIKTIVMHEKEVVAVINNFFDKHALMGKDRTLVKMLLLTSSVYKCLETVYQIVSNELEMSIRAIKLKLVKIKNMLGYRIIHPDDFLKKVVEDIGFVEENIKVFSTSQRGVDIL